MRGRLFLALSGAALVSFAAVAACVGDDSEPASTATNTPDAAPTTTPTTTATTTPPIVDAGSTVDAADAGTMCEQRQKPDAADFTFCEDFDDPARDGGYSFNVLDAGRFLRENGTDFSDPTALNADPGTSSVNQERGGYLRWTINDQTEVHTLNVRIKLRPTVDNNTHVHAQGYTDVIFVSVGTSTIELRYTYGRNLVGLLDYIGYALVVHVPPNDDAGADDAGDAGDAGNNGFTVVPLSAAPASAAWTETYLEIQTGASGAATLTLNNVEVAKATLAIPQATGATVDVGAHGFGAMDAPSQHFLDDIRVDVF